MHRTRALILIALAFALGLAVAACGGGGEVSGEDPHQVLQDTFNNEQSIDSGSFDLSLKVDAEGDQGGTFEGSLGGPFQSQEGKFPQFDLNADINLDTSAQDFSGSAGLTSTGEGAFVSFQDTDYEVPQELFDQFSTSYEQLQQQSQSQGDQGNNFLNSLGIDPTNWLTDLSNEGTEDVDGTETVHISGQADVPRLVEDIKKIAQNAPNVGQQVTPQQLGQLDQLTSIIKSADFDVYSGESDNLLRKLDANLELTPPAGTAGSPDSVTLEVSLTISDVNEPQTISAPTGAQPLANLLQQFGIDPSQLGGALRGGLGAGGALPQSGGSQAAPSGSSSQAYLQCLQQAQGEAAVSECAQLLQ
ncbi:MAG: hypothetical protein ACRDK5_08830 [Solirubrobacterales bacterium]